MLKAFRKIRQKLLSSNKASKYLLYAFGEIILVVIGILIAIQINNWNEWRKERLSEMVVLEDLKDNIIRNNQLIEKSLQKLDEINQSTIIVKSAVENKIEYSDTLNFHFSHSIRHGGFMLRLNKDGYESYKNVGFSIIQNEGLKDQILSLFEVTYSNYDIDLQWGNSAYMGFYGWWDEYFYTIENDLFIPKDYNVILSEKSFMSKIFETQEIRASLQRSINDCLKHNKLVLALILDELNEDL